MDPVRGDAVVRSIATTSHSAAETSPRFDVRVLGGFSLLCDDVALDVGTWPRRGRTLVRLLATTPHHRRVRDEVVEILWSEATPEAGSGNLRCLLHRVRRALDPHLPPPMVLAHGWILLNPDCFWEIDLERFEELAQRAGENVELLQEAAELAGGEPLEEDRYEDWAAPVREHVYRQWRRICLHLASLHRVWGSREEAVRWFERVLGRDPIDEEALQGLLSALGEAGRATEALRRYEQFARRLEAELEVPPAAETLALAASLRSDLEHGGEQPAPPPVAADVALVVPTYPLPTPGSLVGREAVLRTILSALSVADSGEAAAPHLVLLAAEAGMGKTRLLGEAAQRAREAGMMVLAGGCYEQEGRLPYGPIHDALLDYVRAQPDSVLSSRLRNLPDLARILPEVRGRLVEASAVTASDAESQRLRLFSTVAQLLARIMAERPLVLLLDDLQLADEVTLQLLHYLMRQKPLNRLLVIGAFREEEVAQASALEQLLQNAEKEDLVHLEPLSDLDLARLLAESLEAPGDESFVRALHERSGGNPFFAIQMLRLLHEEGRLVRDGTAWRMAPRTTLELPPAVRDAIVRRLRQIGPEEREALTLSAVLGREFGYPALEALWEGPERSLFAALDAAVGVHVVGETEEGYAFQHPLLWEVVYQRVPASRRTVLHERAGLVLERLYGSRAEEHAAELAYHFEAVGQRHPERAVRYLTLAGDAAMEAYAWNEAREWYSRALALAVDVAVIARLRQKLGAVLKTVGRYAEAIEELGRAVEQYSAIGDREGQLHAVADIGRVHLFAGTLDEGIERVKTALGSLGSDASSCGLAALNLALAFLYFARGRYGEQLEAAERASELARSAGDDRLFAEAELARAYTMPFMGRSADFGPAVEEVIRLAEKIGDLTTLCRALCALGPYYSQKGDIDKAARYLSRALELVERLGDRSRIAFVTYTSGHVAFWHGEWDEARAFFERSLSIYRELNARADTMIPLGELGAVAMSRGEWETGIRHLQEHLAVAESTGDFRWLHQVHMLFAERDLLEGRPESARNRIEQLRDVPGLSEDAVLEALPVLARAHLEIGDVERAEQIAGDAVRQARAADIRMILTEALRAQGAVLSRQGRWEEAELRFQEARSLAVATSCPYAAGRTLFEHGTMLLRQGRSEEARRRLEEALSIFSRLGARPYVERTEQALTKQGSTRS